MKIGKVNTPDAVYQLILWYLECGEKAPMAKQMLLGNLPQLSKVVSCELTEESLKRLLGYLVNYEREVGWFQEVGRFFMAAFKDLSSLRNPRAMEIFKNLRKIASPYMNHLNLWARKISKRPDGSAFIILHISDYEVFSQTFKEMAKTVGSYGELEEGLELFVGNEHFRD